MFARNRHLTEIKCNISILLWSFDVLEGVPGPSTERHTITVHAAAVVALYIQSSS